MNTIAKSEEVKGGEGVTEGEGGRSQGTAEHQFLHPPAFALMDEWIYPGYLLI